MSGRVAVVGAGAWGTALALVAARAGNDVVLWGRDAGAIAEMAVRRRNRRYLPHADLPANLRLTSDLADIAGADVVLLVVPAQHLAGLLPALHPHIGADATLLLCAKGIDRASGRFLSEIVAEGLAGPPTGALSGPSFANDVAAGLPTAVTLALADEDAGMAAARRLATPTFRPYWSADVRGVEIGGAMKNVLAIAAGVVVGRGFGESARAAMIARGFAEMNRLGRALGAKPETFAGLSGLGDLVLTATGTQSRNLRFGLALGQGEPAGAALARIGTVEGAATAAAALDLAGRAGVDMPLTATVAALIAGLDSVDAAVDRLMRRPLKAE